MSSERIPSQPDLANAVTGVDSQVSVPSNFFPSMDGLNRALDGVVKQPSNPQLAKSASNQQLEKAPSHPQLQQQSNGQLNKQTSNTQLVQPDQEQQHQQPAAVQQSHEHVHQQQAPASSIAELSRNSSKQLNDSNAELLEVHHQQDQPRPQQPRGPRLMDKQWEEVQKKTFTKWVNTQFQKRKLAPVKTTMAEGNPFTICSKSPVYLIVVRVFGWCSFDSVA